MIKLDIRSKSFADQQVLGDIQFELKENEITVLFGPSGCGKTTLLNILSGLDDVFEGRLNNKQALRLGMIFQEPRLLPWLSVCENIELVATDVDVASLLKDVGVGHAIDLAAGKLSLGMARRVAFARALAVRPDLLVMDEPFVSLDEERAATLRLMVLDLMEKRPCMGLFVTHDLKEAVQLGQRILVLGDSPSRIICEKYVELNAEERRNPSVVENYLKTFAFS